MSNMAEALDFMPRVEKERKEEGSKKTARGLRSQGFVLLFNSE